MGSLEGLFANSSAALDQLLGTITGSVEGILGIFGS
ncbi:hypothetical protein C8K36_102238 [Rhodococcus sp. OK519]|nr:hypothetical protein C8K36_102238 [Rhodococcus sp. OK519]